MDLALHFPTGRVGAFVESMTWFAGLDVPHRREKLLPDGAIELIVDLGSTAKKLYADEAGSAAIDFRRAWISGMQRRPLVIEAQPGASLLVIRFRPGGAHAVVRLEAAALTDAVFDFESVLGAAALSLRQRILDAPTPARRFAAAEAWLGERIGEVAGIHGTVAHMVRRLSRPAGVSVRLLADEIGLSERQALTLFRRHVGLGPKQFARIARFNGLLAQLGDDRGTSPEDLALCGEPMRRPDWARLAAAAGYADQAHLNHEFQAFAGMSPGAYAAAYRGLSNYLPIGVREPASDFDKTAAAPAC